MALETGTYISDLTVTNPVAGDPKSQGDDHLRLLKTALRNSFPGFTGPVVVGGTTAGSVNAYTLTPATAMPAWVEGTVVVCEFHLANTTTTPTLNISGLGAKTIVSCAGAALAASDLLLNRYTALLYDGTNLQLLAVTKNYVDQLAFSSALPAQAGNAGKFVKTDGASASWAYVDNAGTVAAHATTMDPWAYKYITLTGTATTFTGLTAAPQAGMEVELYMNAAHVFTDGAVFEVDGNQNYTAEAGDRVILRAKSTTVFTVHPRKADGTALVPPVTGSYVYLSTVTASASATVDVETTFDATYDNYLLVASGIRVATDGAALHCLQKIGGSYLTTNTYDYAGRSDTNSTPTGFAATNAAQIVISPSMSNLAAANSQFKMSISNPTSTALFKTLDWRGGFTTSTTGLSNRVTEGTGANQGTGALTGLRFLASAGNITSGTFRLYGLKNS